MVHSHCLSLATETCMIKTRRWTSKLCQCRRVPSITTPASGPSASMTYPWEEALVYRFNWVFPLWTICGLWKQMRCASQVSWKDSWRGWRGLFTWACASLSVYVFICYWTGCVGCYPAWCQPYGILKVPTVPIIIPVYTRATCSYKHTNTKIYGEDWFESFSQAAKFTCTNIRSCYIIVCPVFAAGCEIKMKIYALGCVNACWLLANVIVS